MPGNEQPPVPDPTILTTEQLERAIENLKEFLLARIEAQEAICDEKFASMDVRLKDAEKQRVEQKTDTKDAVDAALAAAKEAVKEQTTASERAIEKSETATIKSIDQLGEKFDTAFEGQRRDTDDLKARVGKIESRKEGVVEATGEARASFGQQLAGGSLIVVLLGLAFGIATKL